MPFRMLFLFALAIFTPVHAEKWQVKKSIYRGVSPKVGDVFKVNFLAGDTEELKSNTRKLLTKPLKIKHEKTWLSANALLVESINIDREFKAKIWFELCKRLDIDLVELLVKEEIKNQLMEQKIRIKALQSSNKLDAFCVSRNSDIESIKVNFQRRLTQGIESQLFMSDGKVFTLNWLAEFEALLMVATKEFSANSSMSSDDWKESWQTINNLSLNEIIVPTKKELLSKRFINIGSVLSNRNIGLMPMIQKGQKVNLSLTGSTWLIESSARALSSGFQGEQIKVLVEKGISPIDVVIIDKGKVNAIR